MVGGWSGVLQQFDEAGQRLSHISLGGKILQALHTEDYLVILTPSELIILDKNDISIVIQRIQLKSASFNMALCDGIEPKFSL